MPRFTLLRETARLFVVTLSLGWAATAGAAEDLEFYDSGSAPIPGYLMSEFDPDLPVSSLELRTLLKRIGKAEAQQAKQAIAQERAAARAKAAAAAKKTDPSKKPALEAAASRPEPALSKPEETASVGGSDQPELPLPQLAVFRDTDEFTHPDVDIPHVLSPTDERLYRQIFKLQGKRRWKQADKLIKKLSDKSLLGHVYYERYMHPTGYRSSYKELRDWMKKYRDHPGAERVYNLAVRRRPKNYNYPPRPVRKATREERKYRDRYEGRTGYHRLSSWKRRYIRQTQRRIRIYLQRGRPTSALRVFNAKKVKRVFDTVSYDESRAQVAGGLFHAGKTKKALELAGPAGIRSGDAVPIAHWWAGLAAWRLGKYEEAARHFGAMAETRLRSDWTRSAAAYWAARGYLVSRQPEKVNYYLHKAAGYPRTFYGLLAIRSLGIEPAYDWSMPPTPDRAWQALQEMPHVKRAVALLQVGEDSRAGAELKRIGSTLSPDMARVLVAIAVRHRLPSLALRVARVLRDRDNEIYDSALYPLPEWEPSNGFKIDKALVFAVMRQESRFRTRAKSRAGARGLMQLMPRTASYMAGRRFRGLRRHQLFDPELNMTLGQKYVQHLLEDPNIDGDLFYTVAAYNGGPGNLRKWLRRTDYQDDPLLFIESIPLSETRDYVERVLTNLWIYRYRFGQPAPSLDAIASGEWPSYTPLDNKPSSLASKNAAGL